MKRQRGRGRKPGGGSNYSSGGGGHGNHPNRTLESNGPDIKVRGSASNIYEKYVQLSRDASSAGDRVLSESYAQFAEHYYRMLRAMQPQTPVYEPQRVGQDLDFDEDGDEGDEGEGAEGNEVQGHNQGDGQQGYQQREQRQPYQGDRQNDRQGDRGGDRNGGGQYRDRGYNNRDRGPRTDQRNDQRSDQRQDARPDQRPEQRPEQRHEPRPEQRVEASEGQPYEGEPRQQAEAPGEEGDEIRTPRRGRGRGRARYRAGDERAPGAEGQAEAGPVEGFGDAVPAFVGND